MFMFSSIFGTKTLKILTKEGRRERKHYKEIPRYKTCNANRPKVGNLFFYATRLFKHLSNRMRPHHQFDKYKTLGKYAAVASES